MNLHLVSRRAWLALGAAAIALAGCGGGGSYDSPSPPPVVLETISAKLSGDQEVPTRVDSGATGSATFSLNRSTRTLSGTVTVDGVVPTAAHIHAGAAGSAGAVVVALTVAANYDVSLPATVLTQAQLDSLDAGELYVNIHSAANPGGEIRGQIGREVYTARLTGAQETTPVTSSARGSGRLVLNPKTLAIRGEIEVTGITATAAHIHGGAFGSNGAVLVGLEDGGSGRFSVPANTLLTQAQVDALRAGGLYFNVHSAANPGGEIRGQIGRRVLIASASGVQEVPGNNSAATGRAFVVYDPLTRSIEGSFSVADMTATAAHIHAEQAGANGPVAVALSETAAGSGIFAVPANTTLTAAQAQALLSGGMYANAHSAAFSGGEIRGQLGREVFTASLTGAQETTPVVTAAVGSGTLVLNPETFAIEGEVEVVGVAATAGHIHAGAFGSNGGVQVGLEDHGGHGHLTVPDSTTLTEAQVASLRAGGLYFNVHSAANPGGEIRGQIGRRVLLANANGAQEVASNGSTATGRGFIVYDPATRGIEGSLTLSGMTATIAHIHQAAAGVNGPVAVALAETSAGSGVWAVGAGTVLNAAQAQALLATGMYYNAHSAAFPTGEVRGQLTLQ